MVHHIQHGKSNPASRLGFSAAIVLLTLAFSLLPSRAFSQAVSGSITGAVLDPSGNAIPGAAVKAVNSATGVEFAVTTNEAGHFTISNLIGGRYRLVVTVTGFKVYEQTNIDVRIDSVTRLDLKLEIGSLQESVTVTAAAAQLQTDKVNLGTTLTSGSMQALPTIGKNPTALAKLSAGVIEGPGQEGIPSSNGAGYFSVSVNGQREQLNTHLLDGVADTDPIGGQAPIVPSLDGMQEVSFNTTNYDVEFGQVAGGVTIMTTKSGTNQLHGTVYEYNRVNRLFARNPFTEPEGPGHFVWNQFGASVGGPILKNKLFGFFNYQGVRVRSGGNILTTVPTEAFRRGDFSALNIPVFDPDTGGPGGVGRTPFQNNIIPPERISLVAQNILALIPLPNQPGNDLNFIAPAGHPIDQDAYNWRVDYVLNDANRFFVRHTRTNQKEDCPGVFGAGGGPSGCGDSPQIGTGSDDSLAVDYTHLFSPTFLVEGRFGWTAFRFGLDAPDQSVAASEQVGIPGLNDACPIEHCGGLAGFRIGGPVGAFNAGNSDHSHQLDNRGGYNFVGIASWTRGAHNIKFGADLKWDNSHRFDSSSMGNYGCFNGGLCDGDGFRRSLTGTPDVFDSGLGIASFLLGRSSNFQRILYTNIPPTLLQKRNSIFFQDTWQATRKLTLTLGLRWDYIGYPTSPDPGGLSNFDFNTTDTLIADFGDVSSTANVKNNYRDFAPRIGIAYRLLPNTVLRVGGARTLSIGFYGANFGAINNQWPNATRQRLVQPDPFEPAILLGDAPPAFISGFDILEAAGNPGRYPTPRTSTAFGTDPDNPTHSIYQWNVAIQHQFAPNLTATVAYVGNAARHLFYRRDYNAAVPGPGSFLSRRAYGSLGYLTPAYNQSNQTSSGYHGLQLSVEKRMSQGLFLTTALTWSKSYDFGLHNAFSPFDHNADRAPTDSDRALVFSVGHVWELPFGPNKKFLTSQGPSRFLVGGWEFSGITRWMSGSPFSPTVANGGAILNSDCCTLRPNRIGEGTVSNPTRDQWFDVSAFTLPGQYQFGNAGRNILRGPNFSSADWALAKKFGFGEERRVELRWEVFNAFNRTNLASPVSSIDSALAGRISGIVHPMRRQQLGIHLYW
jgi:outer membrane receptor protein involved in Fe transport